MTSMSVFTKLDQWVPSLPKELVNVIVEYCRRYTFSKELEFRQMERKNMEYELIRKKEGVLLCAFQNEGVLCDDGEELPELKEIKASIGEWYLSLHKTDESRMVYCGDGSGIVNGYYYCKTCLKWHFTDLRRSTCLSLVRSF